MASLAFLVLVLLLVANLARRLDGAAALQALRALPPQALLAALLLGAASHGLYSVYDLVGRHQTGHGLRRGRVMAVGFISYAFNLNLGALVGGVAFRYRLYTGLGLGAGVVTQVMVYSMLTHWLGYLALAGGVLWWAPPTLPPAWGVPPGVLPGGGAVLWAVVAGYALLCAAAPGRALRVRGQVLRCPTPALAALQLLLSGANWLLTAGIVWVLLQQRVPYAHVLGAVLVAAVAGVLTHVPAGLGVVEAVFIALLGSQVPVPQLLAALLAYRLLYYLVPLAVAGGLLLLGFRRRAGHGPCRSVPSPERATHAGRPP